MPSDKVFTVNKYISLKLEGEDTNVYTGGKFFSQCKYLLINIPITQLSSFDEITSIDEAAEKLDHALNPLIDEEGTILRNDRIPPETEFWGHCSNLQVWFENDYDTRLLHRNLAFPLLKRLTEEGDPLAEKVFKREIAKRIDSGTESVIKYLILERYIDRLEFEEVETFLDFQPFINACSSLLDTEFRDTYTRALEKHGMKFPFLRYKNKQAFPVIFWLQKMQKTAQCVLQNLLKKIISQASYNALIYFRIEGLFYVLDYRNFSDQLNAHLINELINGTNQDSHLIFNLSFLMLVFLSYGIYEKREGLSVTKTRLKDNLNFKKNLSPERYASLINNICEGLVDNYDSEQYKFYIKEIYEFFTSFGEHAIEGLTYLLENSSGELFSIAQKCLIKIETENPTLEVGNRPKIDINVRTLLELNSKEIITLIPFRTGAKLVEKFMLQLYEMPKGDAKWDFFEKAYGFFEKIEKENLIELGEGVSIVLAKRNLELTKILIEFKILEYLTQKEVKTIVLTHNSDFVRDFLKVLDLQDHFESKSEFMERLSKFFGLLKGNITKSEENRIKEVFKEFSPTFQNEVVKLHFIEDLTVEDLSALLQVKITDDDLNDYYFIEPFLTNLASNTSLVEEFLTKVTKNQDRKILEGLLDSGYLIYVNIKEFITLNRTILQGFLAMLKNVLGYKDLDDDQLDEDNYEEYDYDWNRHEKIQRLEKRITKISEIKSLASLSKKEIKHNFTLLESLMKKKYLQYLNRDQFWNFFPDECSYLQQIEIYLKHNFTYYPNYRIDNPIKIRDLGFSLKDKTIIFIGFGGFKLTSENIERVFENLVNLSSIERLELQNNKLDFLPEIISKLKKLKYLILAYAGLKSIPETIGDLPNLVHLELYGNHLISLPESIGNLKSLQYLNLRSNDDLKNLPRSIATLTNLKSLYLGRTSLTTLPDSIGDLKSLELLNLDESQITYLPETIGEMTALKGLRLAETPIKNLPDKIGTSKSIKNIDISNTEIKYLPESIKNINSLEEILVSMSYSNSLPALRRLMAPLKSKKVKILFKGRSIPSDFMYLTNDLEGDHPVARNTY